MHNDSLKDVIYVIAGAAVTFVYAMHNSDYSNSSVKAQNLVVVSAQTSPPNFQIWMQVLGYHLVQMQSFK